MLAEILKIAVRNIQRRKLRSLLTISGIAVGIASIVLFISIGEGLKNLVLLSFGEVGNELVVTPGFDKTTGERKTLSMEDLREIEKIEGVAGAAPRLHGFLFLEYRGRVEPVMVLGVDPGREKKLGIELMDGRPLKSSDRYSAVLGFKRQNISGLGGYPGTPQRIKLRRHIILRHSGEEEGYRFRVVGVLREGALAGGAFSGGDRAVLVPRKTLKKLLNLQEEISQIVVKIENPEQTDEIAEKIEKTTGGNVMSLRKVVKSISRFFRIVQLFFFAIGCVALLVAGFGIMNTMLMSVLERTREIGVLKSTGAKRRHILGIFLAEAGIMGLAGGLLGTAVGLLLAKLGNLLMGSLLLRTLHLDETIKVFSLISTPPWLILLAISFSVVVSVIFGLYPAWRASTLHPVEAFRQP
jgi:putative ABC transport system permease protein